MLHQSFISLATSGTVRSMVEERDLITDKLRLIFRKVKFINVDTNLSFEGILQESSTRRWRFQRPTKPFGGSR